MLVTFTSRHRPDVVMFGNVAAILLRAMGARETPPGILRGENIKIAAEKLRSQLHMEIQEIQDTHSPSGLKSEGLKSEDTPIAAGAAEGAAEDTHPSHPSTAESTAEDTHPRGTANDTHRDKTFDDENADETPVPVSLAQRALPLLEMLDAAYENKDDVIWR